MEDMPKDEFKTPEELHAANVAAVKAHLDAAQLVADRLPPTRARAITLTHIDTAALWLTRCAFVLATLATLALSACGTDYAAVLNDAHRLQAAAAAKVAANCPAATNDRLCPAVREGKGVVDAALDVADSALESGLDLERKATEAWTRAKAFYEAVRSLFAGSKTGAVQAPVVSE